MKRLKQHLPLLIVFFLSLGVRLVYNLVVAQGLVARDDSAIYNQIAYALAYNHCYCQFPGIPSISRPPLWPLILSIFYHFTPQPPFQQANSSAAVFDGRLLYCFIGSGTCVLVYLMARDLFGKRIGLITGCFAAIYPGLFIYDGWVYAESLYTFLVTLFTYSLFRLQRTNHLGWAISGGVALGLANLARPNGPVLFGMLAIWAIGVVLAKGLPLRAIAEGVLVTGLVAAAITRSPAHSSWSHSAAAMSFSAPIMTTPPGAQPACGLPRVTSHLAPTCPLSFCWDTTPGDIQRRTTSSPPITPCIGWRPTPAIRSG
jgi:4-amino-4-deoxy-L-arabinose transferase-like glycosyltransferase